MAQMPSSFPEKTPIILDTDIDTDIDDTWAPAMLLRSPELDVKLVVTDTVDTRCRARIKVNCKGLSAFEDLLVSRLT